MWFVPEVVVMIFTAGYEPSSELVIGNEQFRLFMGCLIRP